MFIRQLRPFYTPEERAQVYSRQYDHTRWEDHKERVAKTASILKAMDPEWVVDLSCGDAAIVKAAGLEQYADLGDLVDGPGIDFVGPIEETIHRIPEVDVFLLSETLEHVERPLELLDDIRRKANRLLLTTPVGEDNDCNPEHYWGWDPEGIELILSDTGWMGQYELFTPSVSAYYTFQIWECWK